MEDVELDRALDELERRLGRLHVLYERFFSGLAEREPQGARRDCDERLAALSSQPISDPCVRAKLHAVLRYYDELQQTWERQARRSDVFAHRRSDPTGVRPSVPPADSRVPPAPATSVPPPPPSVAPIASSTMPPRVAFTPPLGTPAVPFAELAAIAAQPGRLAAITRPPLPFQTEDGRALAEAWADAEDVRDRTSLLPPPESGPRARSDANAKTIPTLTFSDTLAPEDEQEEPAELNQRA